MTPNMNLDGGYFLYLFLGSFVMFDIIRTPETEVHSIYYSKKHRFLNIICVILAGLNWDANSKTLPLLLCKALDFGENTGSTFLKGT